MNRSALAALSIAAAIAFGAFGAHGLKDRIDRNLLEAYQSGAHYHLAMGLGLLALANRATRAWGIIFVAHLLFAFSLYLLAITGVRWLGIITPIGGAGLIIGWMLAAWELRRK